LWKPSASSTGETISAPWFRVDCHKMFRSIYTRHATEALNLSQFLPKQSLPASRLRKCKPLAVVELRVSEDLRLFSSLPWFARRLVHRRLAR
jgi:hypothetical protein